MKKILTLILITLSSKINAQTRIVSEQIKNYINDSVVVCEKVYEAKYLEKSQQTILHMGGHFPNHKFTVVIRGVNRTKFHYKPEEHLKDKKICVTGKVGEYAALPQIVITEPSQLKVD